MSYKKMPPQAYTKETLQEAFEWWNQQPEDFRDKVQDKDDLVGYYLKVRRGYPEEKVSEVARASFSSELKGLAKNLDDFEGYQNSVRERQQERKSGFDFDSSSFSPSKSAKAVEVAAQAKGSSSFEPSVQLKFPDMTKSPVVAEPAEQEDGRRAGGSATASSKSLERRSIDEKYFKLDAKSLESVKKIKKALNLSSDQEALRAIVALGASRLDSLLS